MINVHNNAIYTYVYILLVLLCSSNTHSASQSQLGINLEVTDYTNNRLENVFSTLPEVLVKKFEVKGYYPLRISITNNSDKSFVLSKNNISLPVETPQHVAREMQESTPIAPGITIAGIAALFSCILCAENTSITYHQDCGPFYLHLNNYICTNSIRPYLKHFLIGSAGLGVLTYFMHNDTINKSNEYIFDQIRAESYTKNTVIAPGKQVSKLIFVRAKNYYDANKKLFISLNQLGNNANNIVFKIDLN